MRLVISFEYQISFNFFEITCVWTEATGYNANCAHIDGITVISDKVQLNEWVMFFEILVEYAFKIHTFHPINPIQSLHDFDSAFQRHDFIRENK